MILSQGNLTMIPKQFSGLKSTCVARAVFSPCVDYKEYSVRASLCLLRGPKTHNVSAAWMVTRPCFSHHEKRKEKLDNRKTWDEEGRTFICCFQW